MQSKQSITPGFVLIAMGLIAGCGTVNEIALKSQTVAGGKPLTPYMDVGQSVDAQQMHSARRADLARIGVYWQMDEPVWLSSLYDAKEVYRLWYRPSLYDWSVVRVVRAGRGWILSVRTLDSLDRRTLNKCLFSKSQLDPLLCRPPALKMNSERTLQPQELEQLLQQLRKLDFWNQPEQVKVLPEFDGVDWVLEGMQEDGKTRELRHHDPPEKEAFYQFADHLLTLGKVSRP